MEVQTTDYKGFQSQLIIRKKKRKTEIGVPFMGWKELNISDSIHTWKKDGNYWPKTKPGEHLVHLDVHWTQAGQSGIPLWQKQN